MLKLCFAAAATTLLAAPLSAEGLTYSQIKATTYQIDGGDDAGFRLDTSFEVKRARLSYVFAASFYDQVKTNGTSSDYHRASFTSGVDYRLTDTLNLGAEIGRTATNTGARTHIGLGGRYSIDRLKIETAYVHYSTDQRYAHIVGIYEPTDHLTLGAQVWRNWTRGTNNSANTSAALAGRYDAERFQVTGYAESRQNGADKRLAVAGAYHLTSAFDLLAGIGTRSDENTTFRQTALGLRYHVTQQMSLNAIYATSHDTDADTNSPRIGIGVSWDFGTSAYVNTTFNDMRETVIDTIYAYAF